MVYCSRCGTENPDGQGFCFKCGSRLMQTPSAEQPKETAARTTPDAHAGEAPKEQPKPSDAVRPRAIHPKLDVFKSMEEMERSRRTTSKVIGVIAVVAVLAVCCLVAVNWDGNGGEDGTDPYAGYYTGSGTFHFTADGVYDDPYEYSGTMTIYIDDGVMGDISRDIDYEYVGTQIDSGGIDWIPAQPLPDRFPYDPDGLYPPEKIQHMNDYLGVYQYTGYSKTLVNGSDRVNAYGFENGGTTLYVASDGNPYAVEYDYRGVTLTFVRDGWVDRD